MREVSLPEAKIIRDDNKFGAREILAFEAMGSSVL
jgi:hypothetical protein